MSEADVGRRYRILGTLGKGGFGTVYRAELLGEGGFVRQVALKVLNPNVEHVGDIALRLRDEARILGLLRHRAILQVDGLVKLDDRWTVVMEFIEGADLASFMPRAVPTGPGLEVLSEVASALHIAYSWPGSDGQPLKLIHRDIKPPNILLTAAGETKVLDFGIARASFGAREAKTKSILFGSPGYIAPERMDFVEGPAGDVYSLGVVGFEILTGQAFGKAGAKPDRHAQIVEHALGRLRSAGTPREVVELIGAMVHYDPDQRPSARDVESRCRDLRARVQGPWLRDWAETAVPPLLVNRGKGGDHDFSSSVISERTSGLATASSTMSFDADGAKASLAARTFDDEKPGAPIPAKRPTPPPPPTGLVAIPPRPPAVKSAPRVSPPPQRATPAPPPARPKPSSPWLAVTLALLILAVLVGVVVATSGGFMVLLVALFGV